MKQKFQTHLVAYGTCYFIIIIFFCFTFHQNAFTSWRVFFFMFFLKKKKVCAYLYIFVSLLTKTKQKWNNPGCPYVNNEQILLFAWKLLIGGEMSSGNWNLSNITIRIIAIKHQRRFTIRNQKKYIYIILTNLTSNKLFERTIFEIRNINSFLIHPKSVYVVW